MAVAKFGEKLRRERESRRITLDQIAEATKISSRNLRALEEENFGILPGGIFNKGFVRSYARYLGIDEDKAVADYLTAAGEKLPASKIEGGGIPDPPPPPRKPVAQKSTAYSPAFWITTIVLLAVALGLGGWKYYRQYLAERVARAARAAKVAPVPAPAAPAPAETSPLTSETTNSESSGTLTPASVPSAPEHQEEEPVSSSVVVEVSVRQDSWMKLTIDGGAPALQGVLKAGTVRSFSGEREINVVAGNAGGVDISVNGRKVDPLGPEGARRERTFTAND